MTDEREKPALGSVPVQPKAADLSFLSSRKPTRPTASTASPPVSPEDGESPAHASSPPAPVDERPLDRTARTGERQKGAVSPGPVIAYIPSRLRDRLKRTAERTARTYTDVLFDAVDELDERLDGLFPGRAGAPAKSLFSGRSTRRRTPTGQRQDPTVQVPIRPPTPDDLAVLDDRAAQFAAGNRSEFIRVVLDAYLPPR
ncbi:hypothetical protein [Actinomadura atramentaria]|uniref:hypothetical protein n=1 Tax=Actinomadura atramentaria TaxID=1990 RepID=UPI0012FAF89D|nr:hypothetical protein [Actinomadura atramentaria]